MFPARLKDTKANDTAEDASSLSWWCNQIPDYLQRHLRGNNNNNHNNDTKHQNARQSITSFRRSLAISNPKCFERHLPLFALYFWKFMEQQQPQQRHINLHIPKTGGSSLCQYVKRQEQSSNKNNNSKNNNNKNNNNNNNNSNTITTLGQNCWFGIYCPLWCCCQQNLRQQQQRTTQTTQTTVVDFIMNENFFRGFGDAQNRMYSILLREPIARAKSHVHHYVTRTLQQHEQQQQQQQQKQQPNHPAHANVIVLTIPETMDWIRSNYMTWSLVAQQQQQQSNNKNSNNNNHPIRYRPMKEDVPQALAILKQMDYILDITAAAAAFNSTITTTTQCTQDTLQLMGVGSHTDASPPLGHVQKGNYNHHHQQQQPMNHGNDDDDKQYISWNLLDRELYQHARLYMKADCQFFQYLLHTKRHARSKELLL